MIVPLVMWANPHTFRFGPEVMAFSLNTPIDNITVQGNKVFCGIHLEYEYVDCNEFYAGVEFFSLMAADNFNVTKQGVALRQNNDNATFTNVELRLGYTYAKKRWFYSPFVAMGGYLVGSFSHKNFYESLPYLAGGAHVKYIITPCQTINLNFKVFGVGGMKQFDAYGLGKRVNQLMWGGEIALPYVWIFTRKWDLQVEPYFLALNFAERQNAYGLRLLAGYRF